MNEKLKNSKNLFFSNFKFNISNLKLEIMNQFDNQIHLK